MKLQIGDRVQYSRTFLRNIGAYTGHLPIAKGTITAIHKVGSMHVAAIDWGANSLPSDVNVKNLHKIGTPEPA